MMIIVFLTLPLSLVEAQVTLIPSDVPFVVYVIELYPVDDYTGGKQFVGIFGDKSRLDVLWNTRYYPEILDPINVTCWLNCKSKSDIAQCYGQKNCSFEGRPGPGACTILDPGYNYSSINNVTCRFTNPNHPEIEYKLPDGSYPQRVFYPIKYSVSVVGGTYVVGRSVELPVNFISYSFLSGNYTGLAYVDQASFIVVDNSHNTTKTLNYLEMDTVSPKITVIYAGKKTTLYINTTANELPTICTSANDCPDIVTQGYSIKACIQNNCQYIFTTEIGSSYLSLPEYGPKDTLVIFTASIATFLVLLFFSMKN